MLGYELAHFAPEVTMNDTIRERLIRKLQAAHISQGFAYERTILEQMGTSRRQRAKAELSSLLDEGFVVRLGTGRRGHAHRLTLNATWPFDKCPLCGRVKPVEIYAPKKVKNDTH